MEQKFHDKPGILVGDKEIKDAIYIDRLDGRSPHKRDVIERYNSV